MMQQGNPPKSRRKKRGPLARLIINYGLLMMALVVISISAALIVLLPPTNTRSDGTRAPADEPTPGIAPTPTLNLAPLLALPPGEGGSKPLRLARAPEPFTFIPERERTEVSRYTVKEGDTIFGIADHFELKPESLFWGNPDLPQQDLQFLRLGMEMKILPVDGALHIANGQQSVQIIANRYGVDPYDVIFSEYNTLPANTTPETELAFNTALVIPGGEGEPINVSTGTTVEGSGAGGGQVRVTGGPGSCGLVTVNTVGRGVFGLPLAGGYTFMQDFYPGIHNGVDLAGSTGDAVIAADGGTVVFAGWHSGGYGNLVVIDHGNGFQSYYAHLSRVSVRCSAGVSAGQTVGAMGSTGRSTGPHLHFEIQQGGVPTSPLIHVIL